MPSTECALLTAPPIPRTVQRPAAGRSRTTSRTCASVDSPCRAGRCLAWPDGLNLSVVSRHSQYGFTPLFFGKCSRQLRAGVCFRWISLATSALSQARALLRTSCNSLRASIEVGSVTRTMTRSRAPSGVGTTECTTRSLNRRSAESPRERLIVSATWEHNCSCL